MRSTHVGSMIRVGANANVWSDALFTDEKSMQRLRRSHVAVVLTVHLNGSLSRASTVWHVLLDDGRMGWVGERMCDVLA